MRIVDFIREDLILPELHSKAKLDVLAELATHLAARHSGVAIDDLVKVLVERERLASTAIGEGVAIPHGKLDAVGKLVACVGRTRDGVDFDSMDGRPTHLFFVLVAPENSTGVHLKALARISRLFKDPEFRTRLLAARSSREMFDVIADEDANTDKLPGAMFSVRVEHLLNPEAGLSLTLLAGEAGVGRAITVPRIQKPGLALAGFTQQIHPERVQVLGKTEMGYLATLDPAARRAGVANLVSLEPACLILMRGLPAPPDLAELCEQKSVALMGSPLVSSQFIDRITKFLEEQLAPSTSIHGVLMDVLGVGILLLGKSGIGKSEAALDLVMRGHRLVADDIVDIRKKYPDTVFGSGSDIIKHHMEIRGLGIINVKDLFGIAAVRDHKKIELVIELVEWREDEEYDRLGVDELTYSILGVEVPMLRVPVRPGRNMTSIIEVAARNQLLKVQGHHSARQFQDRLNRAIAEATPAPIAGDEVE